MRAQKVKVDPDASFGEAIGRILGVRLDELDSLAKESQSPENVKALHDMRIAAKRVRYVLELGEPVMTGSKPRAKAAKRLQDLLGEIHDCDELLPLVRRHVKRLRTEDAAAATAGEALPNRRKYRGLEALRALTVARRAALFDQFVAEWPKLRRAVGERKAVAA
jgi:CHAD domain-containing protein